MMDVFLILPAQLIYFVLTISYTYAYICIIQLLVTLTIVNKLIYMNILTDVIFPFKRRTCFWKTRHILKIRLVERLVKHIFSQIVNYVYSYLCQIKRKHSTIGKSSVITFERCQKQKNETISSFSFSFLKFIWQYIHVYANVT